MNRVLPGLAARALLLACVLPCGRATPARAQVFANGPLKVQQFGAWTFGLSGPIPAGSNVIGGVTQSGAWTFGLTGAIPPGGNAIGSVLSDLRVSGALVSSANPVPAQVSNFPAVQQVSGSAPVGAAPAVPPVPISGVDGAGLKRHLLLDAAGRTLLGANAPRVTQTGTLGAANAAVTLPVDGMSTAVLRLTGTWSGTVTFLGSVDDGATFDVPVNMIPYSGGAGGAAVGSATANGVWEMAPGGLTHIRAVMASYASGSAGALLVATSGQKSVRVGNPAGNPLTVVGAVTATLSQAGSALSASNPIFASITNLPSVQAISAASLPLPSGAATDSSVQAVKTALGSPFQVGGSIGNAAFGLLQSGSPVSASNPTFVATTNGPGLYSTTLPTLPSGAVGALAVDQNGRLIQSPGATVTATPAPAAFARISCTLPAYAAGGNAVCTDAAGTQTTMTCAANAACQVAAANAARKYLFAMNATAGASISLGYTATAAPGNASALDGPSAAGGQGGTREWGVPPAGAIFAASVTAGAVLVLEQGQ